VNAALFLSKHRYLPYGTGLEADHVRPFIAYLTPETLLVVRRGDKWFLQLTRKKTEIVDLAQFSFRFTTPSLERRVLVDFNRSVSGHGSQKCVLSLV